MDTNTSGSRECDYEKEISNKKVRGFWHNFDFAFHLN